METRRRRIFAYVLLFEPEVFNPQKGMYFHIKKCILWREEQLNRSFGDILRMCKGWAIKPAPAPRPSMIYCAKYIKKITGQKGLK
jgi:hypothetical protein